MESVDQVYVDMAREAQEQVIARSWAGVPSWLKTYYIVLDGYGNWSRGDTLTEAKAELLKRAGSKSHSHFQKCGMIAWQLRQDERCPPPYVNNYGNIVSHVDPFNGDMAIIEKIDVKGAKR